MQSADWLGSVTQATTVRLGISAAANKKEVYAPLKELVPFADPSDLVVGGWDINSMPMGDAMRRAEVLEVQLQQQLREEMNAVVPMAGIYDKDYVAPNQEARANHLIKETNKFKQMEIIREDIRKFKSSNKLDKVIILWTANTERCVDVKAGNFRYEDTDHFLEALKTNCPHISPSIIYATVRDGWMMEGECDRVAE
eukprot:GHVU01032780.1.p2 GENE.GHVU01032780.1~~GHVU01032780.1.p2  ORF type:complete len:197 (+),score=60.69 GHVU01032780.1:1779-2369(+)